MAQAAEGCRWGRLALAGIAIAVVLMTVPAAPGLASVVEQAPGEEEAQVRESSPWTPPHHLSDSYFSRALWSWPEAGLFYQLTVGRLQEFDTWTAYDMRTRKQVAQQTLSPPAWHAGYGNEYYAMGQHLTAAVDRQQGRIFVAFGMKAQNTIGSVVGEEPTGLGVDGTLSDKGSSATPCPGGAVVPCVGGLHVLDGATLDTLGTLPLNLTTGDSAVHPVPRALEYLPPDPERGWGAKLLMLVEDIAHNAMEPIPLRTGNENAIPRRNNAALVYAVQFDLDRMAQEWAVRVDGCRNSREERHVQKDVWPYPMAAFRSGGSNPTLFIGCHVSASNTGVVVRLPLDGEGHPASLPVRTGDPARFAADGVEHGPDGLRDSDALPGPAARPQTVFGPDKVLSIIADPVSRRMLMLAHVDAEVWWVYDADENAFIGTIGIGGYAEGSTHSGIDADQGRLYVLAPAQRWNNQPGGLYIADIRRSPLPQALHFPDLASGIQPHFPLNIIPGRGESPTVLLSMATIVRTGPVKPPTFRWIEDRLPASVDPERTGYEGLTLDLDETPGVTTSTFDGVARGYGFRAILIGGAEAAARVGPADPVGTLRGVQDGPLFGNNQTYTALVSGLRDATVPPPEPCTDKQREVVVAFVGPEGPATVDASGSRGSAQPVLVDRPTQEDAETPFTRCSPLAWEELWSSALMSRPPLGEPKAVWPFTDSRSSCNSTGSESEQWSDPVTGMFSSAAECSEEGVHGWGQARGIAVGELSVSQAIASFRVYRDPGRGMVARVESIARGVVLDGVFKIDTIRGTAESWANGRRNHSAGAEADAGGSDSGTLANCDISRTAGSCFSRSIFGATVSGGAGGPGYRCAGCGEEQALVAALNNALGANGTVRFREPDERLARGSDNGYIAAIQKPDSERYADMVLNSDFLETVLPAVEIIRYSAPNRPSYAGYYPLNVGPRGRQIYQFAGVEAASVYSIQCLLVYDEATNTCGAPAELPGRLVVSLQDPDGIPVAGGAFAVHRDTDSDGVLGLADELIPDGACLTGGDGIGTCVFGELLPGPYLVAQTAAPSGYGRVDEPFAVELAGGEERTVTFTNLSDVSTIEVRAHDESGKPLAGAVFAVHADPDGDGGLAPGSQPVASCTTDGSGACTMRVPAGPYVLVQTTAPAGLAPIEPVAFAFASGGQVAAVSVVNSPADAVPTREPEHRPDVSYTPPSAAAPPADRLTGSVEGEHDGAPAPAVSLPEQLGGTVVQVIRAPADVLRLLARDPKQAVAWTAALALLALAAVTVRRRSLLGSLTALPMPAAVLASTATGVLERPVVAGAAPSVTERVSASVVAATASPALAAVIEDRLGSADNCELLALARSLNELRSMLAANRPDVLVIDLALPTGSSADVCDLLHELHPPTRVLGLIPPSRSPQALTTRGVAAGLGGMLVAFDDIGNGHLSYAIRCVAAGKPCYGPTVQAVLLGSGGMADGLVRRATRTLTAREREVAELAAAGATRTEIAERLYLSPGTVKRHLRAIRAKLGVANPWDREQLRRRLHEATQVDAAVGEAGEHER